MTTTASSPESFESAIGELERLVQEMETGSIPLEQALANYQRGMSLLKACRKTLEDAELRVSQLEAGELIPLDPPSSAGSDA
ncbi:MAG: exodeoxyribonuclease VII small subunit [Rhodocyclaceae bacterium]|nr:exodeoxyribonuclease VII small subunit [Rhodocyclaceae bacterium]